MAHRSFPSPTRSVLFLAGLLAPGLALPATGQDFDKIQIEVLPVTGGVFMLKGAGGNIGLCVGEDGAFLIDDQYAPLTPKILAAVTSVTKEPIKFVVNTHWHGDHTGGNENLGGAGAIIVAHENVRRRMSTEQLTRFGKTPPSPEGALPVVTFTDSLTFHWNGEEINVFHVAPAHTDGDVVIHFKTSDVIHAGDLVFNGLYPFIDVGTGGSVDGMIAATELLVALAGEKTRIIPGHGPLCGRAEVQAFHDMLVGIRDRVRALIAAGKTLDEVKAAKPTAAYDEAWGKGFLKPDDFTEIVYSSLTKS